MTEAKTFSTVLLAALLVAPAASAEPAPEPEEAYYYTEYERSWYGWQTLAVDVPLMTVFFFTLREEKYVPAYSSLTLFALASPGIHVAHDQWKPAAISMLSRVTLSLVGAVGFQGIAKAIDPDASEDAQRAAAVAVTNLAPMAFDAFVLAYEEKETQVEFTHVRWTPQLGFDGRDPWIGVVGTF